MMFSFITTSASVKCSSIHVSLKTICVDSFFEIKHKRFRGRSKEWIPKMLSSPKNTCSNCSKSILLSPRKRSCQRCNKYYCGKCKRECMMHLGWRRWLCKNGYEKIATNKNLSALTHSHETTQVRRIHWYTFQE